MAIIYLCHFLKLLSSRQLVARQASQVESKTSNSNGWQLPYLSVQHTAVVGVEGGGKQKVDHQSVRVRDWEKKW